MASTIGNGRLAINSCVSAQLQEMYNDAGYGDGQRSVVVLGAPTGMPPFDINSLCGSLLNRWAHSHWRSIRRISKSPLYATNMSFNDNFTCRSPSPTSIMPPATVQSGSTGGSCSSAAIDDRVQVVQGVIFPWTR